MARTQILQVKKLVTCYALARYFITCPWKRKDEVTRQGCDIRVSDGKN